MARRFAVSALVAMAAFASVASAAPPVYTVLLLHPFAGPTLPAIELSLNDQGMIAWTEADAFANERLYVQTPQG
ncbi:MAG: hypothetical protein ACREBE_23030, partial [bacterium]